MVNKRSIVFLFAGQGSQYYFMGHNLFASNQTFRNCLLELDEKANQLIGTSVVAYFYDTKKTKGEAFDRLLFSHAALFMVQYALAQTLLSYGIQPSYLVGASLGETVAVALSGAIQPQDALASLINQANIVEQKCQRGGMITILHDPVIYQRVPLLYENAELVSVSYKEHFTLAGSLSALAKIKAYFDEKNILYSLLPVNYAFHSSLLEPAKMDYKSYLETISLKNLSIPLVSCVYGKQVQALSADYFWQVMRRPIMFREAIENLEANGQHFYIDCSVSGTLNNFLGKILSTNSLSVRNVVMNPFSQDSKNFDQLILKLS